MVSTNLEPACRNWFGLGFDSLQLHYALTLCVQNPPTSVGGYFLCPSNVDYSCGFSKPILNCSHLRLR